MIFSTCVVSHDEVVSNSERISLLEDALRVLPDDIDFVAFPAGFLSCRDMEEINDYGKIIRGLSDKYGTHVALGIDCQNINEFGSGSIKQYALPYVTMLATPNEPLRLWRQQAFSSSGNGDLQLSNISESRSINIDGLNIEIVACGDLFNPAVVEDIIGRDTDFVIALVHSGSGARIKHAMERLAKNGVNGFCSLHAKVKNALKYGFLPGLDGGFENISTRENDFLIKSFNQIEIKVWEF